MAYSGGAGLHGSLPNPTSKPAPGPSSLPKPNQGRKGPSRGPANPTVRGPKATAAPKGFGGSNKGAAPTPYTPSQVQRAQALADAQTQGPLAELKASLAANNRQTQGAIKLSGGYFNSLGNFAKQGVTDTQNIGSQLNANLGFIGGAEQQQLQGIGQNAQNTLNQYTPGGTNAPAMQALTQELARQQGLAAQQQGAYKNFGATQGANYSSLAAQNLSSDALAGTQALKGIAQAGTIKNEPLNAKVAALQAQRGALYSADLAKVQQQDVANKFTAQGLGLKDQSLKLTAAQDAARNALTARGQDITAAHNAATEALTASGQAITKARDAANAAYHNATINHKYPAGGTTLSAPQNSKLLGQINRAVGMIKQAQASFGKPGGAQKGQVRTLLAAKTGYPNYVLDAAFELVGYGALSPSTAAYLHGIGLRGGGYKVGSGNQTPRGTLFGQPVTF